MFKLRGQNKLNKNPINKYILILFALILSLTIGFSSFHTGFDIGMLGAHVLIHKDIRVTNIALSSTTGGTISNWQDYDAESISTSIELPNSDSTVTYQVEVTNLGNIEMGIYDITGLPSNLEYSISNYTMKTELCDSTNNAQCKLGSKTLFNITLSYKENLYDSSNTIYSMKLDFDFRRFYSITYSNLDASNLPTQIMEGDTMEFTLNTPYPSNVNFTGTLTSTYDPNTGIVTLVNIRDNVTISSLSKTYFIQFDGATNAGHDGIDKTTIISFSKNTTLTKSEVLAMVNNDQAFLVSTSPDDPDYPSSYEVYAWIDNNNNYYWWSEAPIVYFHPYSINAFKNMTSIVTVDLTGTDTSLVRNFSHWFDKDAKLTTIIGKINTSGLVLEYNPNYTYGNDPDENGSSETGLAYMFNDCKVLKSIDLSEFNTTNAGDMKRMFAGCAKLTSLDVSHFDTSNVKSMYWMFRKNEKLTELDLRNFDTSKVENMVGMFVSDTSIRTIYLGQNFNTSKVKRFNYMFNGMTNLRTIYSYSDLATNSVNASIYMFGSDNNLVGSANTLDATPYDSTHIDASYAKLAQNGIKGYLTPYTSETPYSITYILNGGAANNPTLYYETTRTFTLENPYKIGYTFIGWTGSNGDTPQMEVTIPTGSTGDRTYIANYEAPVVDLFPKVFAITGSCNFNGSASNITGSTCKSDIDGTDYTNGTYIDTGISLYSSENLTKDYEIYFEISNYDPSAQEVMANGNAQNTIMNSKAESSGYPGVVVRKGGNNLEVKSFSTSKTTWYRNVSSYKIARINKKIYYSVNGGDLTLLTDDTGFNSPFDLTVWFGASKDGSGNVFRHSKCTLSNIYIKLGTYN